MADPGAVQPDAVVHAAQLDAGAQAGDASAATEASGRTNWFFYGLGLSLQTLLWFLLFLALVVAIAAGGELTEFRYVGF